MIQNKTIDLIDEQNWLDKAGDILQPAVISAFKSAGAGGYKVKNFLHGKWLGHPLHPVLTDIPVGAWTLAAVLDSAELMGTNKYKKGADAAVAVGIAGALGAAVTGLTDWSQTHNKKRKIGLMHGMLNLTGTALYVTSYVLRKKKTSRSSGIAVSMAAYGIVSLAAYLGGHLVFVEQVGVKNNNRLQS